MSQENVEKLRARFEPSKGVNGAALDWDSDAVQEMFGGDFSPDVELEHFATGLDTRTYRGRDGVFRWLKEWFEPFEEYSTEALDYIAVGDSVVIPTRQRGIGKTSGARVELEVTWVYDFSDGKIVRMTTLTPPKPPS